MCLHPKCKPRTNARADVAADAEVIPTRVERDPTLQATRRKAARRAISKRIREARPQILALLDTIPRERVTIETSARGIADARVILDAQHALCRDHYGVQDDDPRFRAPMTTNELVANRTFYRYDLTPERLAGVSDEIRRILAGLLQTNSRGKPTRWFFDPYIEEAYRTATGQSAARIDAMARGAGLDLPEAAVERVLNSPAYRRRLELVFARAFEDMKGFEGEAAEQLGRALFDGVARGQSPRDIAGSIRAQFDNIEGYRADRIARTEVNKAFTDARLENTIDMRDRLGIEVRVMHVSALSQGTRASHADRHGQVCTPEEQEDWWNDGANRINCLCSTVEVLYRNGQPVQQDLIERQQKRGKAFFKKAG